MLRGIMFDKHIRSLDGLRGFAAFWVVLHHLPVVGLPAIVPGQTGEFGVFLFFILSGFLMGHLYLAKPFNLQTVTAYGIARVARIVPIFYLVVIVSFLVSLWLGPKFIYFLTLKDVFRLLTFNGNKYVFWSVGPEVQFYFLFVGLWWLFANREKAHNAALPIAIFVAALLLFAQPLFPGTIVFNKLHIFLAGALTAPLVARLPSTNSLRNAKSIWVMQLLSIAIFVLLTFSHYYGSRILNPNNVAHDVTFNAIYGDYRWVVLMTSILIIIAIDTPISRAVFANRAMQLAGSYSFSVYLLHEPVMMGVRNLVAPLALSSTAEVVLALLGVVAIGPVSFMLVEKPSQRWFRTHLQRLADLVLKRPAVEDRTSAAGSVAAKGV